MQSQVAVAFKVAVHSCNYSTHTRGEPRPSVQCWSGLGCSLGRSLEAWHTFGTAREKMQMQANWCNQNPKAQVKTCALNSPRQFQLESNLISNSKCSVAFDDVSQTWPRLGRRQRLSLIASLRVKSAKRISLVMQSHAMSVPGAQDQDQARQDKTRSPH